MSLLAENFTGEMIKDLRSQLAIDSIKSRNGNVSDYRLKILNRDVKLSWACRTIDYSLNYKVDFYPAYGPQVGDVAVCRVERVVNHSRLTLNNNKRLRLYRGDLFLGVFGNRYATDAFEAEVCGLENLNILTGAGMIGTVKSKHSDIKEPTEISFLGFLNNEEEKRINTKYLSNCYGTFNRSSIKKLIVTIGTGMNSGKTTVASKLIKGLSEKGLKVAACKITGSVSHRDLDEMHAASACIVKDFSDYGYPSTYLSSREELIELFHNMLIDVNRENPDIIITEIADGLLQRETNILLEDNNLKKIVSGIVLTAESAPSALYGVSRLRELGYKILTVSGVFTSSPLSVEEFRTNCDLPVGYSDGSSNKISEIIGNLVCGGSNE